MFFAYFLELFLSSRYDKGRDVFVILRYILYINTGCPWGGRTTLQSCNFRKLFVTNQFIIITLIILLSIAKYYDIALIVKFDRGLSEFNILYLAFPVQLLKKSKNVSRMPLPRKTEHKMLNEFVPKVTLLRPLDPEGKTSMKCL